MEQANIDQNYYKFSKYVSLDRFNTYWFQINEVLNLEPKSVAEIGVGTGVVKYLVEGFGVPVTTIDINENLKPDVVAPITAAAAALNGKTFDLVLCSRVFHHIPFADVEAAIKNIWQLTHKHAVLVLAAEDFRLYAALRLTSKRERFFSIPIPLFVKRMLISALRASSEYYYNIWKVGSAKHTRKANIDALISMKFSIIKSYPVPKNHGHIIYVLEKK